MPTYYTANTGSISLTEYERLQEEARRQQQARMKDLAHLAHLAHLAQGFATEPEKPKAKPVAPEWLRRAFGE